MFAQHFVKIKSNYTKTNNNSIKTQNNKDNKNEKLIFD